MNVQKPEELKEIFLENKPFPHIVIDGLWDEKNLKNIENELKNFTDWDGEKRFFGSQKKFFCSDPYKLPPFSLNFIHYLNSKDFLNYLELLTGNESLIPDPYLFGAGIHAIKKGGFLKMHTDFNWHPKLKIHRVLNVLIYLNSNWKNSWKGNLLLNDENSNTLVEIEPKINRMVVFRTDDISIHGHPEPLDCPEELSRKAIALYYYSSSRNDGGIINSQRTETDYEY